MSERHIVALGGGGFSELGAESLIDSYVLGLAGKERPSVCFLPTASGDGSAYIEKFYAAFAPPRANPSHVSLLHGPAFDPHPESLVNLGPGFREHLLSRDVIYVGGGNTVAMLAVWRAHAFDSLLREAWEAGVVLCGLSAGSLCWFEAGTSDARGGGLEPLYDGLGLLAGSHCPHYDSEPERRPAYSRWIAEGMLPPGYAADDHAALHFAGGALSAVVSERETANAYRVTSGGEETLARTLLRA